MSDSWQEAEEKLRAGLAYRAMQRELEHQAARAKAAEAWLAEAVAALKELCEAADQSVNCATGSDDDTAAMLRFGKADEAARAFLAQCSEKKE